MDAMKYRLVVQVTDDRGTTREAPLMPEIASAPGWRCAHALWPDWAKTDETTACGWCNEPLVACEIVECPWCGWYVPTEDVVEHWDQGCDD
jgi:hypothetical protein